MTSVVLSQPSPLRDLASSAPIKQDFDITKAFHRILEDEAISTPLAAVMALTELIQNSDAGTMFELVKALNDGAEALKQHTANPISLNAGCELFIAFVTLFPHDSANFSDLKAELIRQGQNYATEALTYRKKIAELAVGFIKDGSIILTHSYSRVVMQTLLLAHKQKRISVFVTEARPRGLGIKTAEALTAAGVPSTVILDSAVAYVMEKVDFVLVGSEAVVESGGLINAVGSNQMAIIARAANKPFYALAESYKFHRLFPLSQYDLPSHNSSILSFSIPNPEISTVSSSSSSQDQDKSEANRNKLVPTPITQEYISRNNPDVDYTRPDLITLVFSDVGSLTPEGVSQYLVGMFAG
ncbi:nagb/rpia/CoA transferase-like protein [Pluteus cervinus]|uniref:Nagb/rpia/CoA transferase-like protein n=1 Tax=Pluteus cervinus TaxID=181527 RepID=A0ACD3BFF6_9AGAR|nr:nagb/rpia/CoA transferase-like protein [Pluteus cervinus]